MKKTFFVEVEYEELEGNAEEKADVFYDAALESAIENLMSGYKESGYIKGGFTVKVKEY